MRCYCCGDEIDQTKSFTLVSMQRAPDRAFIMINDHVSRVGDAVVAIRVKAVAAGDGSGRLAS